MTRDSATIPGTGGVGSNDVPPLSETSSPVIELADYREIASMAGTTMGTVRSWRGRVQDGFPPPNFVISNKPLWLREDIEAWLASRPVRPRRKR